MADALSAALNTPGATVDDLGEQAGAYWTGARNSGGWSGADGDQGEGMSLPSQNEAKPTLVPGTTPAQNPTGCLHFQTPPTQVTGAVMAALKGKVLAQTEEEVRQEFRHQPSFGAAKKTDFLEKALGFAGEIRAYGVVYRNSSRIKVLHGLGKYFGSVTEINGKIIARSGEWTSVSSPYLLQMPDNNTGNWQKVRYCDDPILLADFHTDAANWGMCFKRPDDAHIVESELPFLIYLPGIVAVFAMEKERTTHEVLEFITTLSNEESAGIVAGDIELMKHWLMAAGQKQKL